ncbi:MAG: OsmC family peroxiredoxin [Desulfobacteraceae bacterium]|nr:MAG: OsmC family peroxiredoxin [Desulfobacteraceae bacterium]
MPIRTAEAKWEGKIREGRGTMKLGSGAFEGTYSFKTRFEEEPGTNPDELLGAAHAGCFSMAFSLLLEKAGFTPRTIRTRARVKIEQTGPGFSITGIELDTEADVPEIDENTFMAQAEAAKNNCPVSRALAGTPISLKARLLR